ncbi:MAG: class I SAM-dependent methyltransferase [Phycisphaerales bacterium]|nr:class I SAM-dependent methyltransferase [Phycisphaerales bacterium]
MSSAPSSTSSGVLKPDPAGAMDASSATPPASPHRALAAERARAYDDVYKGWHVKRITRESYEASTRFFLDAPPDQPGHLDGNELALAFRLLDVEHLSGRRILDFCCGAGRSSIYFALRGADVWACDRSPQAIHIAAESAKLSGVADRVQFCAADAQELAYPDCFFDAVFCQSALHILIDYPEVSTELARVLKPGGKAVFCDEALGHNPLLEIVRWVRRRKHVRCGGRTLRLGDLRAFGRPFAQTRIHTFNLLLQSKQFFGQAAHRPWAKFVLRKLRTADETMLSALPFLRRFCGKVVVEYARNAE